MSGQMRAGVWVDGEPFTEVQCLEWAPPHDRYEEGYRVGFEDGATLGVARMRSLANDFEAMAGAMAGVPSHWAAQMAKALRRDADAFEEEVCGE